MFMCERTRRFVRHFPFLSSLANVVSERRFCNWSTVICRQYRQNENIYLASVFVTRLVQRKGTEYSSIDLCSSDILPVPVAARSKA